MVRVWLNGEPYGVFTLSFSFEVQRLLLQDFPLAVIWVQESP